MTLSLIIDVHMVQGLEQTRQALYQRVVSPDLGLLSCVVRASLEPYVLKVDFEIHIA